MERGKFIVLEGPDNSGKTTQCGILTEFLNTQDIPAVSLREPGGTKLGEALRGVLLECRSNMIPPVVQTRMFVAARRAFVNECLLPRFDRGVSVVSDRHRLSTEVYQGYTQGVPLELIDQIHGDLSALIRPDIGIVIDIPVEESLRRNNNEDRQNQQTIFEQQALDFHTLVRRGYLELAHQRSIPVIDGTRSIAEVSQEIQRLVSPIFSR